MDAELIAIQRVKKAVSGLTEPAQFRVLQYVVQGMYETQQERQRHASNASEFTGPGAMAVGASSVARMSEARQQTNPEARQHQAN